MVVAAADNLVVSRIRSLVLTILLGNMRRLLVVSLLLLFALDAAGQSLSDGVRLLREPLPSSVRTMGMNGALVAGVADYSALSMNPAALAPLEFREFSLSLNHREHASRASFLGNAKEETLGATHLAALGLMFAVPTVRGHLAVGISYDRVHEYASGYRFEGANSTSSFLNTEGFLDDQGIARNETVQEYMEFLDEKNLAWALYLTENIDSTNTTLRTRLKSGLNERGTVTEEGGMNALRFGAGIDIAPNISVGATLNMLFGRYESRRVLHVEDLAGLYAGESGGAPNGFESASITDLRTNDQTGFNVKLGLLARPLDMLALGVTIETPTYFRIEDAFVRTAKSQFRSGETFESEASQEPLITNTYDIFTPFRFGAGTAVTLFHTTVSASAHLYDASQLRYSNSPIDLEDLNDAARDRLGSVMSWSIGAEHVISPLGLSLRAGYGVEPSPYTADAGEFDTKTLSAGVGVLLSASSMIEAAFRQSAFVTDHVVYSDRTPEGNSARAVVDRDDVTRNEFSVSFSYRF